MGQGIRARSLKATIQGLSIQPSRLPIVASVSFIALLLLFVGFGNSPTRLKATFYHDPSSQPARISLARYRSLEAIQNATLGFEKILAINLPERTDYRDGLSLAAAVSNIKVDFIDGVHGDAVLDKVLPPNHHGSPAPALRGSWRAHVNALRSVVENNWTTALIFEADVDWDVRVRDVLTDIALASEAVLSRRQQSAIDLSDIPLTNTSPISPYGDGWDIVWLGHCGMQIKEGSNVVRIENDETVPEAHFVHTWNSEERSPLEDFPPHTRIVSQVDDCVCSIAYAVTQHGARQLLNSLGLHRLNAPVDIMLREWCAGINEDDPHVCVGTLPTVFASHRPAGSTAGDSDMAMPAEGFRDKGFTQNIRWSVRMNMNRILRGQADLEDQFPNTVVEELG